MSRRYYRDLGDRLNRVTKGCRHSMHEPDEQGVSARVFGTSFDNAGTPDEMMVVLKRDDASEPVHVNLATLVAMARAAASYLDLDVVLDDGFVDTKKKKKR